MSWVNMCERCKNKNACSRGEVDAHFIADDCEGDECTAWIPDDCPDRTKKDDSQNKQTKCSVCGGLLDMYGSCPHCESQEAGGVE